MNIRIVFRYSNSITTRRTIICIPAKNWIIRKYLLRNVISSVPVLLTLNAADAVLVLGGLGFLGLGLPESVPEWGSDLNLALSALPTGIWWTALYPGIAMFLLVLGLSFVGDGLEGWISDNSNRAE